MIAALAVVQVCLFQVAAIPAVLKIYKRQSSADCSTWREWLVLCGVVIQLGIMIHEQASWPVLASPIASAASLLVLLSVIYRYR